MPERNPNPLTSVDYWDRGYAVHLEGRHRQTWKRELKQHLPAWVIRIHQAWYRQKEKWRLPAHADYLLQEVLLRSYLEGRKSIKGLEIGSAPGTRSLALYRRFGILPYGLEYTSSGARLQRELYSESGLPEDWVICGDLLDDQLRATWKSEFDLVASYGFIEHFDNPSDIIDKHLEFLRPGGLLVVTVPNLNPGTWYGRLVRRFNPSVYSMHNIQTCSMPEFPRIFDRADCRVEYCGPLGGCDVTFLPDGRRLSRAVAAVLRGSNPWTNRLNHLLYGKKLVEFPRSATMLAAVVIKQPGKKNRIGSERGPA